MDIKKPAILTISEEFSAGSKNDLNILKLNLPYALLARIRLNDFSG